MNIVQKAHNEHIYQLYKVVLKFAYLKFLPISTVVMACWASILPQWRGKNYNFLPRHWGSIEGQVQQLWASHNYWRYCAVVSEYLSSHSVIGIRKKVNSVRNGIMSQSHCVRTCIMNQSHCVIIVSKTQSQSVGIGIMTEAHRAIISILIISHCVIIYVVI